MKTVFFDIDTQLDFLYPTGALYVPGAERIVRAIARLNRFAAANGIPLVSTADAHTENDPEFKSWPPHCIAGTLGQRKAEATLIEKRVVVPNRAGGFALAGAPQIVLEKQHVNVFTTVTVSPLLDALGAADCVVYGVVTEVCVLHAALGLLHKGLGVTVVTDAVETLRAEDSARALDGIVAVGGKLATVSTIV